MQMRDREGRWPWLEWKGPPTWQEERGYRRADAEPRWLSWLEGGRGREERDEREWDDRGMPPPPWDDFDDDERRWETGRAATAARGAAAARLDAQAGSVYTPPGSGGIMSDAEAKSRWYAERDAQQRWADRRQTRGFYGSSERAAKAIRDAKLARRPGSAVSDMAGVGNVVSPTYAARYERYAEKDAQQRWADRRRTQVYDTTDRAAKTTRDAAFARIPDVPVASMASSRNVSPSYADRYGRYDERDWQQRFADRRRPREYDPSMRAAKVAREAAFARYSDVPVASMASSGNVSPDYADRYGRWDERDWQQRLADKSRSRDLYDTNERFGERSPSRYDPSERGAQMTRDNAFGRPSEVHSVAAMAGNVSPSYADQYYRWDERDWQKRLADRGRSPYDPSDRAAEATRDYQVMAVEATAPGGEMMEVDVDGVQMAVVVPEGVFPGESFTFQAPIPDRRSGRY